MIGFAPPAPGQAGPGGDQLIAFTSFFSLLQTLRRRWRTWSATAAAGVAVAMAFSLVVPPAHTATTTMLLIHPAGSNGADAMATDRDLAKTLTVANKAIDLLGLHLAARDLLSTYQVTASTNDILSLTLQAPTAAEAVRRADGVARAFLGFRQDEFSRQAKVASDALNARLTALNADLAVVTDKINNFPPLPDVPGVRTLGDLLTERTRISDEIAQIRQRIDAVQFDPAAVIGSSRIVDPAAPDPRSVKRTLLTNVAAGLIGGLAIGAGVVVLKALLSDRIRRRDDVAASLGVPVGVSVRRRVPSGPARPDAATDRIVSHVRRLLASSVAGELPTARDQPVHTVGSQVVAVSREQGAPTPTRRGPNPTTLIVASIDSDDAAALTVASTATTLAGDGAKVLVVDLSPDGLLGRVFKVPTDTTSVLQPGGNGSTVWVAFPGRDGPSHELDVNQLRNQAETVLTLVSVVPGLGALRLAGWGSTAVAVVTAGRSTAAGLRSVADLLLEAGIQLRSTVLVGADRDDESVAMPGEWPVGPFAGAQVPVDNP